MCDKAISPANNSATKVYSHYSRTKWKRVAPVDVLVVRQPRSMIATRQQWLKDWCQAKKTLVVVLFHHPTEWINRSHALGGIAKIVHALAYHTRTWLLKAEACGAATWSTYMVTIACRND